MFQHPVLVIGFNRPNLMNELLLILEKFGAIDLFVALDGPRNLKEKNLCEEVYQVIVSFQKNMNIRVLRRSYNLGCMLGVVSALDWFFEQNYFGVVLEDDCHPEQEFFDFITKFRNNKSVNDLKNIKIAAAHNPFDMKLNSQNTSAALIHGWATHSEVWTAIRKNYFKQNFPSIKNVSGNTRNLTNAMYWWANSTRAKIGVVDTWDGIFSEQAWRLGFQTLIPDRNLIKNVGFGVAATHTRDPNGSNLVSLSKQEAAASDLDDLLSKQYYKIGKRHLLTSSLRVIFEYYKIFHNRDFESVLSQDLSLRTIENL